MLWPPPACSAGFLARFVAGYCGFLTRAMDMPPSSSERQPTWPLTVMGKLDEPLRQAHVNRAATEFDPIELGDSIPFTRFENLSKQAAFLANQS